MSSVNPFSTQVAQTGAPVTGQTAALSGAKSGVTSAQAGGAFWQFLFGLVGEEGSAKDKDLFTKIATAPEKVVENAKHKLNEGRPLSLPELVVMLQEQDKDIPVDFKELNIEEVAAKIDELNKAINDMIAALPAEAQANPFAEILVGRLQHRLENLQTTLDAIETVSEEQLVAMISFGLTPKQMTEAVSRIHEVEEKIGRPLTAEDLVAGVGGILQPVKPGSENPALIGVTDENTLEISDAKNFAFEEDLEAEINTNSDEQAIISPPLSVNQNPVLAQFVLNKLANLPNQTSASDKLAAQLNAMNVGAGDISLEEPIGEVRSYKGLDLIAKLAAATLDPSGAGQKTAHIMKATFADLIQANANASGALTVSKGFFSPFFDGASVSADQDIAAVLPMTHAAQAAHSVISIPQAGHTHPATQMVSATISKMAKDGTPKSMRIELDPPELGRVNVTLEFGPEKTAKIHVLAEKPETYLMLQRDAALLERALQDTGLNTDSASLSFELAEDGSAFNSKEDGNDKGGSGRRANAGDEDDLDLIHSTVNWQIDPNTGLTRYNIMA